MSELIEFLLKDSEPVQISSSEIGRFGEKAALDFLMREGFQIISANFKVPVGRNRKGVTVTGEIDIIALEDERLCFVEVKTRSSDLFSSPLDAIDLRKQRQIIRTARVFRKLFGVKKMEYRFDALAIILNGNKAPNFDFRRNFWSEEKFRKSLWSGDIY